jgi:hypothetical protein
LRSTCKVINEEKTKTKWSIGIQSLVVDDKLIKEPE